MRIPLNMVNGKLKWVKIGNETLFHHKNLESKEGLLHIDGSIFLPWLMVF